MAVLVTYRIHKICKYIYIYSMFKLVKYAVLDFYCSLGTIIINNYIHFYTSISSTLII